MQGPINYNLVDPSAALINGLNIGNSLNATQRQAEIDAAAKIKAQQAEQAALQMQNDFRSVLANPNAGHAEYAALQLKYPTQAENVGKAFKTWEEGKQKTAIEFGSRVYGALQSGNTPLAIELMKQKAKADPSAAPEMNMLAGLADADPQAAKLMWATTLAGMHGPDKFAEAYSKIGGEQRAQDQAPADLKKKSADAEAAVSDATIKAEQAKVAPQAVLLDLQKKGWDIEKIKADIQNAKEDNRIKAMTAAISRETNDLKRDELRLKVEEARTKQADALRTKVADVESSRSSIDNFLNQADRILAKMVGPDGKPTALARAAFGPIDSRTPTIQQDVADLEALVETLGSQAFMSVIPNLKGLGALSNAEGDKAQSSLQNFSLRQSADQFVTNLKEGQRLMMKGRKNLSARYGVPDSVPDTPAAAQATSGADIDALVKKYAR